MNAAAPADAVIVCVGNSLAGDDAAGCAVHDALTGRLPPRARLRLLGVGGIALLDDLQGEEFLIVVDAVQLGAVPGTVHVLAWDAIPAAEGAAVSLHGVGIREAGAVGRTLYPEIMPPRVYLVGIEGCRFDRLGEGMTPAVAAAIEEAVDKVLKLIASQGDSHDEP